MHALHQGNQNSSPFSSLLPSFQAELMSGLIEYCIELNAAAEGIAQEPVAVAAPSSESQSSQVERQRAKLQRQSSVVSSRIQHLSTIDYVEDGKLAKQHCLPPHVKAKVQYCCVDHC